MVGQLWLFFALVGAAQAIAPHKPSSKNSPLQKVECEYVITQDDIYCFLKDITLTTREYRFIPWAENTTAIRNVVVQQSTIPVLSSDICDTFKNLETLNFWPSDIETVKPTAFSNCRKLKFLSLTTQKIAKLDKRTFSGLTELENLYLAGNQLTRLDDELFLDLKSLSSLHLYFNHLTEFSTALLRKTRSLEYLFIYTNEIFDFDIEGIYRHVPDLKTLSFGDNNLRCSRLQEILNRVETEQTEVPPVNNARERLFGYQIVRDQACLDDVTWAAEHQRYLLESQTKALAAVSGELARDLVMAIKSK